MVKDSHDAVALIEEGVEEDSAHSQVESKPRTVLILGSLVLVAVVVVAANSALKITTERTERAHADVGSVAEKAGMMETIAAMAEGLGTAAKISKDLQQSEKDIQGAYGAFSKPGEDAKKDVETNGAKLLHADKLSANETERLNSLKGTELFPHNDLTDGNPCPDDEEEFGDLCYAKCADLTKNQYPIRTTAFACCKELPCSFFNTKFTSPFSLCAGSDVNGEKEGKGCPHTPGDCLQTEEFKFGVCYKKCALLTENAYPYRSGTNECCRYHNHFACLDPLNKKISSNFTLGGAVGDSELGETMGEPHTPVPAFAEEQTTTKAYR